MHDPPPLARATLSADEFARLGKEFATASAHHSPSWAWVDASAAPLTGSFGASSSAPGFLCASPILMPARTNAFHDGAENATDGGPTEDLVATMPEVSVDDSALCGAATALPDRLDLHIVYSATYHVPVLLLHGHHSNGAPWSPDNLRAFLSAHPSRTVEDSVASDEQRLAPLSGAVISQLEHPVLRTPSCCVDPCETASLMGALLSGGMADGDDSRLDYLSAWWSVLAPLVGATSHSAWFAKRPARARH